MASTPDDIRIEPPAFRLQVVLTLLVAGLLAYTTPTLASLAYVSDEAVVAGLCRYAVAAILLVLWWRSVRWKPSLLLVVATLYFAIEYVRLCADVIRSLIRMG